jgi:HAD superfamily hydrolase (TIGR01509 family)
MIKAVIFDFFDVIYSDPYNAWLKNHGYIREGGFLEASKKMDLGQIELNTFFDLLSALSFQSTRSIRNEYKKVGEINHNALKIVTDLKEHYKIGLLSNATSGFIRRILKNNSLNKYFDEIVISSEVGYIKPSKEIFDIILKRLAVSPSEALFIDDNKRYIDGAENIGIKSFQYTSASQLSKDLLGAEIIHT